MSAVVGAGWWRAMNLTSPHGWRIPPTALETHEDSS